jgi:hypothetical protein
MLKCGSQSGKKIGRHGDCALSGVVCGSTRNRSSGVSTRSRSKRRAVGLDESLFGRTAQHHIGTRDHAALRVEPCIFEVGQVRLELASCGLRGSKRILCIG